MSSSQNAGIPKGLEGAMFRFRSMAVWAGVMSILLWFVDLPVKYIWPDSTLHTIVKWVPIVHGFTYPIYVLAAFHYCIKARKSLTTTVLFILAGTLPIASFIAERRAIAEFKARA
jgi:integral membrane protein